MARRSSRSSGRTERNTSRRSGGKTEAKSGRLFHRGSEAIDRVEDELAQQKVRKEEAKKKAGQPLRFFLKPGQTKEIVILDEKPDFFMYEHTIKDPRTGKWGLNLPCIKEHDNCPVCERVKESIYTMFLSVLDLTGFEDSKRTWHEFSRKLLCVKPSQQKKYLRRYDKEGTLRGAIFEVTRDGDMDANIGNDIEFLEFMDEEELSNDYISEWTDRDNKRHVDNNGEVIDYLDLFEEPTAESLRAIVGGEAPGGSGSRRSQEESLDNQDDGWEEEEDKGAPWKGDEEEGEDEGGEDKSRRSSSRRSSSGRSSSGRSSRQDRDEEDEGEEETRSRRKPKGNRSSTRQDKRDDREEKTSRRTRHSRRR